MHDIGLVSLEKSLKLPLKNKYNLPSVGTDRRPPNH
jgi:hypothetical protein